MANPSSGDIDSPDPMELSSNIGTWVAAGLAIIALVGVVGPLLALRASASDKNRAMNAVRDQQQKYVSRGFRLTRGLRIFRTVRVPNLSPGYITNEPDTAPLVPSLRAALGRWVLKPRDYMPWNSGWAKFSELIEAYEVRDGSSNGLVDLCVPRTGGSLEIVNSRTALVVNKHWVLLLGLLGRYGERADKGILKNRGIRRDLMEERASIRRFDFPTKEQERPESELRSLVYKKDKYGLSNSEWRGSSGTRDSDSSYDSEPGSRKMILTVRRSAYGAITLEETPQLTIHGITGKMQELGRHKGSWSYLTSISFIPHTAREIFGAGIMERRDNSSLQVLFWLAHGFLPCGRTPGGRQRVISLESPPPQFDGLNHPTHAATDWPTYSLRESEDIPISMARAMQCMGIPEPEVLQFLPVDAAINEKRIREAINSTSVGNGDARVVDLRYPLITDEDDGSNSSRRFNGLKVQGAWVYYYRPSQEHFCAFQRDDLERVLRLILTLNWDDWGFLVWKDRFWTSILKDSMRMLRTQLNNSTFIRMSGLESHARVFRWRHRQIYHAQKHIDHIGLDKFLTGYFEKLEILPLRLALGTLYILDSSFRKLTERVYTRLCNNDERGNETEVDQMKQQVLELERKLAEVEASYWDAIEFHNAEVRPQPSFGPPAKESNEQRQDRAMYTRAPTTDIDIETLEKFGIDYEFEVGNPCFYLTCGCKLIVESYLT